MQGEGYCACACGCGEKTWVATKTWARHGWVKGQPVQFVHGHHTRPAGPEYEEQDRGYRTPCWVWLRALRNGYGVARRDGGGQGPAHRIYYERHVGPIPEGLQLDHLCRVPACVNPAHLEPVTLQENLRRGYGPSAQNSRKTHCPRGHALDEANTYHPPKAPHKRECLTCRRERTQRQHERERAAKEASA